MKITNPSRPMLVYAGSCGKAVLVLKYMYSEYILYQYFTCTQCGTTTVVSYTCMTYMHDKEHILLLRGTFRALPLERLNFVESRATDKNFVRNLLISHIGLLNICVTSVV